MDSQNNIKNETAASHYRNLRIVEKLTWVDGYGTGDRQTVITFKIVRDVMETDYFTRKDGTRIEFTPEVIKNGFEIETLKSYDNAVLLLNALKSLQ